MDKPANPTRPAAPPSAPSGEAACCLRPLATQHVDAVLAIAGSSPEASQWRAADYHRACSDHPANAPNDYHAWVAEVGGCVAGFIVVRPLPGEIEILNLAVEPSARRIGVAGRLLELAFTLERLFGARKAFLEVRASNAPAIRFYEKHGFAPSGRRSNYYSNPAEDALLLSRAL